MQSAATQTTNEPTPTVDKTPTATVVTQRKKRTPETHPVPAQSENKETPRTDKKPSFPWKILEIPGTIFMFVFYVICKIVQGIFLPFTFAFSVVHSLFTSGSASPGASVDSASKTPYASNNQSEKQEAGPSQTVTTEQPLPTASAAPETQTLGTTNDTAGPSQTVTAKQPLPTASAAPETQTLGTTNDTAGPSQTVTAKQPLPTASAAPETHPGTSNDHLSTSLETATAVATVAAKTAFSQITR